MIRHHLDRNLAIILLTGLVATAAGAAPDGLCVPSSIQLCLPGGPAGRIAATATYEGPDGNPVAATAVAADGDRLGYFATGDRRFAEVWGKLLDACFFNGHYWTKLLGVSDRAFSVTIEDLESGQQKTYSTTPGEVGPTLIDTKGFSSCPIPPAPDGQPDSPRGGSTTLELAGGRFQVTAVNSQTSAGRSHQLTAYSGLFLFFSTTDNPDAMVKMVPHLDTGFFEVAVAAIQFEASITVTDICNSEQKVYELVVGQSLADATAFPTSFETCGLFADGFESGTTTAWIAATGL